MNKSMQYHKFGKSVKLNKNNYLNWLNAETNFSINTKEKQIIKVENKSGL